ncbi:MAG: S-layer homology domain-containing protein [Cyanobacteria bacterium P01_D01_bin.105]
MSVVYVSPSGQDQHEGTAQFPLKTLTRALQEAGPGTVIQVAPGTYQAAEQWPLVVPAGVTVAGSSAQPVMIKGGAASSQSNSQHVGVVLGDRAQIRNITLTNPQGSGLFTREGAALVVNSRFVDCLQHGVIVSDRARPFISNNEFVGSGRSGVQANDSVKGEIRKNRFEQNLTGIELTGQAAPLVTDNQIASSQYGIVIAGSARPVLRKNEVTASQAALHTQDRAHPDLGHPQDLGHNHFQSTRHDLRNESVPLTTAGNQINPVRVQGSLRYLASQIPDEMAVPPVLLGNVALQPGPPSGSAPDASGDTESGRAEGFHTLDSRFNDLVGHWSAPFVEVLAEKNLVKGFIDGTFQPDAQVTRAQFAALVAAAFPDQPATQPLLRFRDVSASFWAAQAIRQAQTQGFISGFPDGSFRPNAPMTRVQAIVALANGVSFADGPEDALGDDDSPENGSSGGHSESLLVYGDRAQIPSYAVEPVAAATERQMVVSYPDPSQLRPLEPITRAETTALVHQALVATGSAERIASPFIPRAAIASANFIDLSERHWAWAFIEPMVKQGWLSGFRDGSFQPEAPMTRAQFAALLVGAFEPTPQRPPQRFRDVEDSFWAAGVIQQAYRAQFISGFPDLTFDPNFPLTKLQALLALVSGLKLQTVSPPQRRSLQAFSDRSDIPQYAENAIATATQLGLVFNRPNLAELRPNRATTRAEVSAMVYQALVVDAKMPAVPSPDRIVVN